MIRYLIINFFAPNVETTTNIFIIIISIISLFLTALSYFFSWIKSSILYLIIFFAFNICFTHSLLYKEHIVVFYMIISISCIIPVALLITFALDVKYALFCLDTSFLIPIVWILMPFILPVNLFFYFIIK